MEKETTTKQIIYELKCCGLLNPIETYERKFQNIAIAAKTALKLFKYLKRQKLNGFQEFVAIDFFNKLLEGKNLYPLTAKRSEWKKCDTQFKYQSKRNPNCFTNDFKYYIDFSDSYNLVEKDGFITRRPIEEFRRFELEG